MASTINASTSSGLVQTADTSGVLQLQSNGTTIATIGPTGLSTQVGAPAFSAYAGSATSCSNGAFTKVTFDTEEYDTNSNFASSAFTPTVAGYYQINAGANLASTAASFLICIFKNGSEYKRGAFANGATLNNAVVSSVVYCNGTTDYIDIRIYQNQGGAINTGTGASTTWVNGVMVRSA